VPSWGRGRFGEGCPSRGGVAHSKLMVKRSLCPALDWREMMPSLARRARALRAVFSCAPIQRAIRATEGQHRPSSSAWSAKA
jgi:hypothetical protein